MIGNELGEMRTGNPIASWDESAPHHAVTLSVRRHGTAILDTVAPVRVESDEGRDVEKIAAGAGLLEHGTNTFGDGVPSRRDFFSRLFERPNGHGRGGIGGEPCDDLP